METPAPEDGETISDIHNYLATFNKDLQYQSTNSGTGISNKDIKSISVLFFFELF